jgi:hypothetical protein
MFTLSHYWFGHYHRKSSRQFKRIRSVYLPICTVNCRFVGPHFFIFFSMNSSIHWMVRVIKWNLRHRSLSNINIDTIKYDVEFIEEDIQQPKRLDRFLVPEQVTTSFASNVTIERCVVEFNSSADISSFQLNLMWTLTRWDFAVVERVHHWQWYVRLVLALFSNI